MSGKICGVDIGTMNLVSAKFNEKKIIKVNSLRNMFLKVEGAMMSSVELNNINFDHIKSEGDGEDPIIYMIGDECFKMSRMFGLPVRRPMENGVISTKDIDAMDILTKMLEKITGKTKNGICVYSVPAQAIDDDMPPVTYHEKVFNKIFSALGYNAKPLNEAMAIVFAECEKENFSGITISFGCGLTNIGYAYKGVPIFTFSVKRGGDYIDNYVAKSLNMPVTKVTALKEGKLNLNTVGVSKNKKEKQALQALVFAYQDLITYCIDKFVTKFAESSDNIDIDEAIPIVVSGGTSCPPGFLDLFKEVFYNRNDFPYEISEIRQTDNPFGSVATGCLIYAAWKQTELDKNKI